MDNNNLALIISSKADSSYAVLTGIWCHEYYWETPIHVVFSFWVLGEELGQCGMSTDRQTCHVCCSLIGWGAGGLQLVRKEMLSRLYNAFGYLSGRWQHYLGSLVYPKQMHQFKTRLRGGNTPQCPTVLYRMSLARNEFRLSNQIVHESSCPGFHGN